MLSSDRVQIRLLVAEEKPRLLSLLVFFGKKSRKNAQKFEANRFLPEIKLHDEAVPRRWVLVRDKDFAAESFHPTLVRSAEPVRIGALCGELTQNTGLDPFGFFFHAGRVR